ELRATLTAMWLVNNALLVAAMGVRGELTPGTLLSSAALLPAVILGVALGERHAGRVDAETFRRAVWVTLLLAGIPLVFAA
ncbi:MAG TPA: TSUP family transporter, partial [Myxococcota bacterium]|nr:TSUP family transporter [Myxococcota bacterium]